MALKRATSLYFVTVLRCEEVGAEQQENHVSLLEMLTYLIREILSRNNSPVVPRCNESGASQHRQVNLELVSHRLVDV